MHNGQCDTCARVGEVANATMPNGVKVELCSDCIYMMLDKAPGGYNPTVSFKLHDGTWELTYVDIYHVRVSRNIGGDGHVWHLAQLEPPLRQIAEAWIKGLREPRIDH